MVIVVPLAFLRWSLPRRDRGLLVSLASFETLVIPHALHASLLEEKDINLQHIGALQVVAE